MGELGQVKNEIFKLEFRGLIKIQFSRCDVTFFTERASVTLRLIILIAGVTTSTTNDIDKTVTLQNGPSVLFTETCVPIRDVEIINKKDDLCLVSLLQLIYIVLF